jgi:hypothetical protein
MIPSSKAADWRERRTALRQLAAFLLASAAAGITAGHGKEEKGSVCVNLSGLDPSERKRRELDNYTEKSSDPGKTCGGCAFFSRGAEGAACGHCQIFNGPANPNGRCDDWTARRA